MKKLMIAATLAVATLSAVEIKAETNWSPVGVGIAAPVQWPWVTSSVYGLRFGGLCGYNNDVYGLDLGVLDFAEGTTGSLAAGFANIVYGEGYGLQAAALNYDGAFYGMQVGALNWANYESRGLVIGAANVNLQDFAGFAIGAVNYAGSASAVQIGAFNCAYEAKGLQIGFLNACDRLYGVQIGAFNIIANSKLPIMVIANASF